MMTPDPALTHAAPTQTHSRTLIVQAGHYTMPILLRASVRLLTAHLCCTDSFAQAERSKAHRLQRR